MAGHDEVLVTARLTLRAFGPAQPLANQAQALRAAFGAAAGLMLTQIGLWGLSRIMGLADQGVWVHPLMMAPLGASAVLIYAVPTSPMAQPWSVVVGNSLAAALALNVLQLGLPSGAALGVAVFASLVAMAWARCLHPPGGAVALATVLAAPLGWQAGLLWLGLTVFAGSVLLMGFGVAFHRIFGRPYPFTT